MAARSKERDGNRPKTQGDEMPVAELARAILAREINPRVGQVRQLAEAVLAKSKKPKGKGKKKDKKRKLAKIPRGKTAA
jgi:hypothetical protein